MNYTAKQISKIEKNIWKYIGILITNKKAAVAILSVFYLSVPGVETHHIGWIMLVGSLSSFFFEIPSGYLSDKIGHKNMLIISKLLFVFSSLLFLFATNIYYLFFAGACLSLGFACNSGTGPAFMHDTLKALNRDSEYAKIMGKSAALGFTVPLIFSASAPFLIRYSYKAPFVLELILSIIGLGFAISLRRIKHSEEHKKIVKETNFIDVLKESNKLNYTSIAVLSGFIIGAITGIQVYRAPYQEFMGASVLWFGVYFAIGRIISSLILTHSEKIKDIFKNVYSFQLFQITIYSIIIIGILLTKNIYLIIALFILFNALQWGLSQVEINFNLDIISKSKFKATLFSLRGQVKEFTLAISTISLGYLISKYSYDQAFIIYAIFFVVVSAILYINALRKRSSNELQPSRAK